MRLQLGILSDYVQVQHEDRGKVLVLGAVKHNRLIRSVNTLETVIDFAELVKVLENLGYTLEKKCSSST